jgi:hypothetical protein
MSGLYRITWDARVPAATVNTGTFVLHADFFAGDPFAGGLFLAGADDQFASYRATLMQTEWSLAVRPEHQSRRLT